MTLAGLLKGDLVFEFGQLPEKVRGEEGIVVGLFQFSSTDRVKNQWKLQRTPERDPCISVVVTVDS